MARAEYTARSYAQSGLIAQWDGIENAGYGVHDASAAKPVELVSGIETTLTGTMPAGDTYFMFGSGYLYFTSETIQNAVNSGELTVEIVAKTTGDYTKNGGLLAFGNSVRGFWVWQNGHAGEVISSYSYRSTAAVNETVLVENAFTASYLLSASSSRYGFNGIVSEDLTRGDTDMVDADCYLGRLGGKYKTYSQAYVFSIRIYSRKLTDAEVAQNAAIDRTRFGIRTETGDQALFRPCDANETAQSYAQNGLIAQWDGIENAGYGVHDATAAKPVELVSGIETTLTGTMPAGDKYFKFGSGYLHFTSETIQNAVNSGELTVEIVARTTGSYTKNGGLLALGQSKTARGFWVWQNGRDGEVISSYSYRAKGAVNESVLVTNAFTATYLLSAASSRYCFNGIFRAELTRGATDMADADCYLGKLGEDYPNYPRADVFSVRIYNRVLSPAEVAKNAAIDRRRFAGADVAGAASYVRSGLLAQWDGAENAGYGLHEVSSDAPVELASGYVDEITHNATNRIPADGKAFVMGSGFIKFQSQEIIDALNAGHATVEMVAAKNGDYVKNGGFFGFGDTARAFWLYQQNSASGFVRALSYHAKVSDEFVNINYNDDGTNTLTFLLSDGESASYNTNGFLRGSFTRHTTDTADSTCFVGKLGNDIAVLPNAKVFSVRVYGRLLTDAELENNQLVDRLRFNARVWTEGDAPPAGSTARVVGGVATASAPVDLEVLALEKGGTLDLPSDVTVGAHVLLTNGVAVARGGYTGSGPRGQKVSWLSGPGLLRVGGGLSEDIPAVSEFPACGLIIKIR